MKRYLFALLAAFLASAAFAATDVNKATQAELEAINGIGPSMSTKIMDERKKAAFKDWGDLTHRVKGIGDGNSKKYSAGGLTVNGAAYDGSATSAGKSSTHRSAKAELKTETASAKK